MRTLAVIPAYNEQECLAATVASLRASCPHVDYLVVNDGSLDRTGAICDELGLSHVDMPVNLGLASGVRTGMSYALRHGYDAVVQFDADGQHLPETIPLLERALEEGADIAIGSRELAGGGASGARGVGARLIRWLIRSATGQTITDPTSGLRMYDRAMMERMTRGFDVAPEPDGIALLIRQGARVVEVPARMRERQGGQSYLRLSTSVAYMARTCLSLLLFVRFR